MARKNKYDVIVVGSGPAGTSAAYPLVMAGMKVALIDGGYTPQEVPKNKFTNFDSLRKNMTTQRKFFLGNDLSGIVPSEKNHTSYMSQGRFSYVSEGVEQNLPIESKNVEVLQTLAKGGLSEVWGAACDVLKNEEIMALGLPSKGMKESYQQVIDRIGVSGRADDYRLQAPLKSDAHARAIIKKYEKRKRLFESSGLVVRTPLMAVSTEKSLHGEANQYRDLDYWDDKQKSVYKARFTVEELEKHKNFHYIPSRKVESVQEEREGASILSKNLKNGKLNTIKSKYVILAAGSVNTTRILLTSLDLYDTPVPFLTKPHIVTTCLHPKSLFTNDQVKHSLCQLFIEDKRKERGLNAAFSQVYSYKSLLLFKLLPFIPLSAPESLSLVSLLAPSFVLIDTRFPSFLSRENNCFLRKTPNGDRMIVNYKSQLNVKNALRKIKNLRAKLRSLGLIPLNSKYLPDGSTAHYAGGAPCLPNKDKNFPISTDEKGKVHQMSNVYVADAASWSALPAKPPTLTIMARANIIGQEVLGRLLFNKKIKSVKRSKKR